MRGTAGGRDRGRSPQSDIRSERADRIKALRDNLGNGLRYDRNGRLEVDPELAGRVDALENRPAPVRVRMAIDETGGSVDDVLEEIPTVSASVTQSEVNAAIAAMANNIAELQAQNKKLRSALVKHGVVE